MLKTEITLKKPLDYESVHSMTIEIEAKVKWPNWMFIWFQSLSLSLSIQNNLIVYFYVSIGSLLYLYATLRPIL